MASAADRLAAAKGELESSYASTLSTLIKRGASITPGDRLAAAKAALEASLSNADSSLTKRDLAAAADRLAAAKSALEGSFSAGSLKQRDVVSQASAADRLAAAKAGLESALGRLARRADNKSDEVTPGDAELPVSNFQKTVVPIVIGLVLFTLFAAAASFIVYRRRKRSKAAESAEHRRKHLDLEDDGADEDFGYELPQGQRVPHAGPDFGAQRVQGDGEQAKKAKAEHGEQAGKEFV